jgi:hypothetical protein
VGHACCRPFRLPVPDYPTMLRFHFPLIEPDRRISRIRLSDKAGKTNVIHQIRRLGPIGCSTVCDLRPLTGVVDLRQCSWTLHAFDAGLELRPLPSTGVTRLQRYYEPLRHPRRPGLSLAGVRLAVTCRHRWGFPCFVALLCRRAVATTPVGPLGACIVRFPRGLGLPRYTGGSAPTSLVSRPAQRLLTLRPADSQSRPKRPHPSKALAISLPPLPLRLLPARTIVAGRD